MTSMTMKQRSLLWARNLFLPGPKPWMILDTETTCLDETAEIIEIAAIDCDGEVLLHTLVQSEDYITPSAQAVHGITDEELKHAPTFPDVWPRIQRLMELRPRVITYNASFDARMVAQTRLRHSLPLVPNLAKTLEFQCLMNHYAWVKNESGLHGKPKWHRLSEAIAQQEIAVDWQWHRALGDCQASLALLRKMAEIAEAELPREEVPSV